MKRVAPFSLLLIIFLFVGLFVYVSYIQAREYLDARIEISVPLVAEVHESTSAPSLIPVEQVIDGDTVDVLLGGEIVRIRLIGINTPETVDPRKPVECFGKEASQKTRELLISGFVRIEGDLSQGEYDKYQRRLAYLFTPDGVLVNLALIAEGYAYEYTYRTPYKYQAQFQKAEDDARINERGLWAKGVCE